MKYGLTELEEKNPVVDVLTLHGENDPLADGWRHPVLRYAQVGPHLGPRYADEIQNLAVDLDLLCGITKGGRKS